MRKTTHLAALAALALGLAACGGKSAKSDPYSEIVPDAAAVTLEAQPASAAGALQAQAAPIQDPALLTSSVDDLQQVKDRVAHLNADLHKVLDRLEDVMATDGHELPGQVKVWGPAIRCVEPGTGACVAQASLRLVVRLVNDRRGGFVLEARDAASTSDADFKPVVAGWLLRAEHARRGVGRLWVNFENLRAAAPGFLGQGYLGAGFAAGPYAKAARYRMIGFTRDPARHAPVTVAFAGWRSAAGVLRARAVGVGDYDTAGPANELGAWRAIYHPVLGGIAFSVISNFHPVAAPSTTVGDVPAGYYWFGRSCYASGSTTPEFKEWLLCPTAEGPRACVADAGAGRQVVIGSGTWAGTSCFTALEPDAVKAPAGIPSGNPLDDSGEDAETDSGLAPQAAPDPQVVETTPPA